MNWKLRGRVLDFQDRCQIMAVLNVTPDSFYDGGRYLSPDAAVERALEMEAEGADILDIGGESTRPSTLYGSVQAVDSDEECRRILPVVEAVRLRSNIPISVDTTKEPVARRALDAGADLINDISALEADPAMKDLVGAREVPVILMHDGNRSALKVDPVTEVKLYLEKRAADSETSGIARSKIALDPGLGFGKGPAQSLTLLQRLQDLVGLGYPVLIGASRKSFVWKTLGSTAAEALEGSLAAAAVAVSKGARILRVHDVKETVRVSQMVQAIAQSTDRPGESGCV